MVLEKLKLMLKNKWVVIPLVFVLILIGVILYKSANRGKPQNTGRPDSFIPIASSTAEPTKSVELQKAIESQKKADTEYENWETYKVETNPWHGELPLYAENYYVYFDLDKKVFVGRLYPKVSDSVTDIKTEIARQLREDLNVPADRMKFEWVIIPK